jgi:DNA-binding transcriptional ArsR family regulator
MKIKASQMHAAAGAAEELLKALANRHRLMILCQLSEKERSVGELAELLDLRDSTVSQHLALLRKDGLVTTRREAQTVWYAIASPAARRMIETLYRIYCAPTATCGAPPPRSSRSRKPSEKASR